MSIHVVRGDELTAQDVYDIWKIRDVVFAVEQECNEPDVDGRDLLPDTTHLWLEDSDGPTSYLRVLDEPDGPRIGRVCTRHDQRGRGQSGRLMAAVHERWSGRAFRLNAQAHLERWYTSFGYTRSGVNFMEAGIDHVPMTREAV